MPRRALLSERRTQSFRNLGTAEARQAGQKLAAVIYAAQGEPEEYDEKHERQFLAAWEETIEAMRPDTAPEG